MAAASCAPVLQQGRRAFQVIDDPVRPSVVSFSHAEGWDDGSSSGLLLCADG